MPVSELEKKPEKIMRAARMDKRRPSGASFKRWFGSVCSDALYLEEKAGWEQAL